MLTILTTLTLAALPQAVDPVGSLQRLDIPDDPQGIVTIDVELNGKLSELVLAPHSIRSAEFHLYATRPNGDVIEVPAPAPNTYRGTVTGWPDSSVCATINGEGLTAIVVDYAADIEWQIQPAKGLPLGVYSVALAADIDIPYGQCGVNGAPFNSVPTGPGTASLGSGYQLCEIAFDADFEFYQRNGSSVQATLDDIERVMNRVDDIYTRDCDVTYQITTVVIRSSSNDPYTSSDAGTLLNQFRSHWNANFSGTRKDVAHLFTGRNVNGGTIGIAFLGVICNQTNGYGLSESRFTNNISARTGLTAHEVGHNFSANHCDGNGDCRIMCSGLGGCNNDVSRFGAASANTIRNFAISRPCLLNLASPLALPVFDDFPTTQLNRDIWISFQNTDITTAALNEPSAPNSIRLAALNANPAFDDRLITNKLLMAGLNSATVSFYSEHRGVPNGGALDVEILDSQNNWQLLTRLVSDGIDQTTFDFHSIAVPLNAFHDEAQIRITADVNSGAQQWFIDDFLVDDTSCGGVSNYCVGAANSVNLGGAQLALNGSTSITSNNLILVATSCPSQSFGIFIYGDAQVQVPLGNGFLCVSGSPIYRLAINQADFFGNNVIALDQNNLPAGSVITAGDTFNFQLWYRDSVGVGYNLTNGLEVNFCP